MHGINRINLALLIIIGISLLASCSRTRSSNIGPPSPPKQESHATVVPLSDINLGLIGTIASEGRVQDRDYNDLPVVANLIAHGKESVPYLISKLDNEGRIEGHVIDYWSEVRVGDVALIILTDFFTDDDLQNTTIPGVGWDQFLERGANRDLTGEQVLRNYISKHGRKQIKDRWEKIWSEYHHRLYWDKNEKCFRLA